MKRIIIGGISLFLGLACITAGTLGAIEETVKVTGASFNIGSAVGSGSTGGGTTTGGNSALKIYKSVLGSPVDTNLADSMLAPTFSNMNYAWTDKIPVKLYNKGSKTMNIISKVDYISDPDTLRDDIMAKVVEWNDSNNNGLVDSGEEGQEYGYNTLLRWRNDTFVLGTISPLSTKGLILKFDGTGLSEANANQSAVFDFTFTGVEQL